MKICIIGTGYVGLVSGVCFADAGHDVICLDNNKQKILSLQQGKMPLYEPGLEELAVKNVELKRLSFTSSIEDGVNKSDVIFIAVPTPPQNDGSVDLSYIEQVAREISSVLRPESYKVIVDKSTVPVKTGEKVKSTIQRYNPSATFSVVSNPEFLREGTAVSDLMKPDRIVIGSSEPKAIEMMKRVYEPFQSHILITDMNSAELIKHAANSFLSLKISYINALSVICDACGADVEMVAEGMGMDHRIGRSFLNAGLGYGGSCFPKDVKAFIAIAEELGISFNLLKEVENINAQQVTCFIKKIKDALWILKDKHICVWGLTFKPETDDVRNSVAIELINVLSKEGANVIVYDPKGMEKAKEYNLLSSNVKFACSPTEASKGAEALVIATEWKEFAEQDFSLIKSLMHTPLIFDGRNLLDPKHMKEQGFIYTGVGRGNFISS